MDNQSQVILTFIHAGGAAKTSTTRDLGAELTRRGKKVLLIDLDAQANLTDWLGVEDVRPEQTVQATLERKTDLPEPRQAHGMDIIPSHLDLVQTEAMLPGLHNPEGRLRLALDKIRASGKYDFIFLDAPPSLGKITANGANAADWLLIPLPATRKGLDALRGLRGAIEMYTESNPNLQVALYLITQATHTNTSRDVIEMYRQILPGQLAGPITSRPGVYGDCLLYSRPIDATTPDAYTEIQQATDDLLKRIGQA